MTLVKSDYEAFLESKTIKDCPSGRPIKAAEINGTLFAFQNAIVRWAVRRGRAAVFADCGLGKTFIQLEWARLVGNRTLIVAPLAVARQTIREAEKLGISAHYAKTQSEAKDFTITNYERIEAFDPSAFDCVVLDESSILKSFDGKTRSLLIGMFQKLPYRLCCTATPSPNDIAEIANHAEFLGIMSRVEMLATFFVHDEQHWRIKGHAEDAFWKWLSSWSMCLRKPSDLGFSDDGFTLPPIHYKDHVVTTSYREGDMLFGAELCGIQGRIAARRGTISERVKAAADLVNSNSEQWIVWCGLNSESNALASAISDAVEVVGSDKPEEKEDALIRFASGQARVLITKPSIAGYGMNFQNCHNVVFVGLSDSFEDLYQATRRCWRFMQQHQVNVHFVTSDAEGAVVSNVHRKEREFDKLHQRMIKHMITYEKQEIHGATRQTTTHIRDVERGEGWIMNLGDTCEITPEMATDSIDFSICSPPFASLYTYTNSSRDMGNSRNEDEFFGHYNFLLPHWIRVTKPGRIAAVHVSQIPAMLSRDGSIGLKDFRSRVVRDHVAAGWIFHGEVCVDKNPQAQAIRTKAKGLTFTQLEKDSSWLRPALADYILLFRKPGENAVPVKPTVSRDQWIEYARPCWYGIHETNTLNVAEAREDKDERHICPLQLDLIDRAVRLWSNIGETVFSPFAGIGSEGYQSLLNDRKFIGNELKAQYWKLACENLKRAHAKRNEGLLFKL
jgi:DNA modification methylase